MARKLISARRARKKSRKKEDEFHEAKFADKLIRAAAKQGLYQVLFYWRLSEEMEARLINLGYDLVFDNNLPLLTEVRWEQ